jgi:large subunit ribosomal protein L13
MIIDATGLILGRLAAFAAKQALMGEEVNIVNCEKAIITGGKRFIVKRYTQKIHRGEPHHGPFFPRRPDLIIRRTIRGMLPYKQYKGEIAFKRVKGYVGKPENLNGEMITIQRAHKSKLSNTKFITLLDLCKHIGYKNEGS